MPTALGVGQVHPFDCSFRLPGLMFVLPVGYELVLALDMATWTPPFLRVTRTKQSLFH